MYITVKSSQGHSHILAQQERSHSCGIACVGMIIGRMRGQLFNEKILRQYSGVFDQGKYKAGTAGYKAGVGTEMENLAIMLRKASITAVLNHFPDVMSPFTKAQISRPVLGHILWKNGAGHFVVVDGVFNHRVVVCDPLREYGLSEVKHMPWYNPDGRSDGKFSGWIITT